MAEKTTERYIEAVGRRKTSIARVRITPSKEESFVINEKSLAEYFPTIDLQKIAKEALPSSEVKQKFAVSVRVTGGGIKSQAESIRLGLSRTLVKFDGEKRGILKKLGFLKRDPRIKERKKFGLRKARRAPQWSKR